ncbi:uncharacterized protein LOC121987613 [Zingiber officinale]|uniref:HMA domain-containing protein n=1 Tax=Zingiber officinale TaxID=94328 RepID=A0A8J5G9Y2_ZINOF|nr:uncharacterized protein LOC121987613 [Zingiber officinale]KAG6504015.1 hypothetical protein ZIOFF_036339 [Zingiber officinale]
MAAIYPLSASISSRRSLPGLSLPLNPLFPVLHRRSISLSSKRLTVSRKSIRAVAEGEAANPLEDPATDTVVAAATEEEEGATVAVPVSPSDLLTMYFQAEGTMDESAIPVVSKALQVSEGISDVSVRVDEGIATVELTKQTTVQATGVASNLVEIIQGAGFKLQSLNLSFEDEEDAVAVR